MTAPSGAQPVWTDVERAGVAWRESGSGTPLVFLHGLGGTRGSWNPQLEYFASTRRCLAWDMPGYGASAPVEPLTFATIADQFALMLDVAEIDVADVVGLSFGGMHALHAALRHPDRIDRLVLAGTSPAFGMDGTHPDDWMADRFGPLDAGETPASMASGVLDAIAARPLETTVRSDLIEAFGRIPVAGFRAAVQCLPTNDVRDQIHRIEHPSLVIVGQLDAETPVSYAKVLADGLANAELVVLDGIGHLSPSEDSPRFNDLVNTFMQSTYSKAAGDPS